MADASPVGPAPALGLGQYCDLIGQDVLELLLHGEAATALEREWLTVALFHASYRAEVPGFESIELDTGFFEAAAELGFHFREIIVLASILRENRDAQAGELSLAVANQIPVVRALVDLLHLEDHTRLGKGERATVGTRGEQAIRLFAGVGDQVLGTLLMLGRFKIATGHVLAALESNGARRSGKDPKTLLQEVLGAPPTYIMEAEWGPDHRKEFRWRVVGPSGLSAIGEGKSKKEAQVRAAEAMLKRLRPAATTKDTGSRRAYAPLDDLPKQHITRVRDLCREFGLGEPHVPLVSQALVHTSWVAEHARLYNARHYGPLARVGATALGLAFWFEITLRVAQGSKLARRPSAGFLSELQTLELAEVLSIAPAIALGKGQASAGVTPSIRANAAQAVIGALLLANGPQKFLSDCPRTLANWVQTRSRDAISGVRPGDARTELQECLVPLSVEAQYHLIGTGPDHARRFRSRLLLRCGGYQALAQGQEEGAKRAAESKVARPVLTIIRAVHRPWSARLRDAVTSGTLARDVTAVTVCGPVRAQRLRADRIERLGLFNLRSLSRGDVAGFFEWVRDVETVAPLEWTPVAEALFRDLAALTGRRAGSPLAPLLHDLSTAVASLDIRDATSITGSTWFGSLLEAASVARLSSRPLIRVDLGDKVRGWSLMHPSVSINASSVGAGPIWLNEREGALDYLLSAITSAADTCGAAVGIDVAPETIALAVSREAADLITARWDDSRLLWFLRALLGAERRAGAGGAIRIAMPTEVGTQWAHRAVSTYANALLDAIPRGDLLAGQLHDLKNHLVAAELAALTGANTRTDRLALDHQVSRHLDEAATLAALVSESARQLTPGELQRLDIQGFLRNYVSDQLRHAPPSVQVLPPTADDRFSLTTSPVLLRAILENFVKNAFEAMPRGGRLSIDWVGDPASGSCVIEVSDTGPGLPIEVQRRVRTRQPSPSSKVGGSGIGIWTAIDLATRIGVDCTFQSSDKGTIWTLVVPDLEEPNIAEVIDGDEMVS